MKVLHVYRTYFPDPVGGVQEVIRQTAHATSKLGVENKIYVLSPNPSPSRFSAPEGEVIRERSWLAPASCDLGGISSLKTFRELCDWSDVVQFQFPWPFGDVLNIVSRMKKPTVITYQSDIVRQKFLNKLYQPLLWRTLRNADAIVASSPTYAATSDVLGSDVVKSKLRIIPNGIADFNNYERDSKKETQILMKFGLKGVAFTLSVGVLRYYKGLHTLVEAAKNVKGFVVIAGSGPEEDALRRQIRDSGVPNVRMIGHISDEEKTVLLKHCSVYVLPSHLRSEAFGMVLVEASMFGKPMVCCEIASGPSFINKHGVTGLVVPPERPDHMAEAINTLLGDDERRLFMGEAARQRYLDNFSEKVLGEAYCSLYNEIVENKS